MLRTQICTTLHCDVCGTELTDESEGYTPHATSAREIADTALLHGWTVTADNLTAVCRNSKRSQRERPRPATWCWPPTAT